MNHRAAHLEDLLRRILSEWNGCLTDKQWDLVREVREALNPRRRRQIVSDSNDRLDVAVKAALAGGPMFFRDLLSYLGSQKDDFRPLDRSLQRLRKKGEVVISKKGWMLTPPKGAK